MSTTNATTITVKYDINPMSPRELDDFTTLFSAHSRYAIDQYEGKKQDEVRLALADSELVEYDDHDDYQVSDLYEIAQEARDTIAAVLPVYMYEHSGVTLNTSGFSCPWDSGQIGFICITKERAKELLGVSNLTEEHTQKLYETLEQEVAMLSKYLEGDIYTIEVNNERYEITEYCTSLMGYDDVLHAVREVMEWYPKLKTVPARVVSEDLYLEDEVKDELEDLGYVVI
jgi:hypothetical protein